MATKRIRWTEQEWFDVMREAMPYREQSGCSIPDAIGWAQKRVLPKSRLRPAETFPTVAYHDWADRIAGGWVPEGAAPAVPEETPAHTPNQGERDATIEATFTSAKHVYWTQHEWALLACRVKHMRDAGDAR